MKICSFAVLFFMASLMISKAQSDTVYLDDDRSKVSHRSEASYFRIYNEAAHSEFVGMKEYYISGELSTEGFVDAEHVNSFNGLNKRYYKNGQLKWSGEYERNRRDGLWKFWYKNGQLKEVIEYNTDKDKVLDQYYKIVSYYDSLGNQLVKDGTGHYINYYDNSSAKVEEGDLDNFKKVGKWQGYYQNGEKYFEEYYQNGELTEGTSYDTVGNAYSYTEVIIQPEYSNGISGYYDYVAKELRYPADARRRGIQGRVYVQFTIDTLGNVKSVSALKGIGGGCDMEAAKIIRNSSSWSPRYVRGQKEEAKMILPITFKLSDSNTSNLNNVRKSRSPKKLYFGMVTIGILIAFFTLAN